MHAASRVHCSTDAPGLARVRAWRMHAEVLRDSAEAPALTTGQRTALLRDAVVAERQAQPPGRRRRPIRTERCQGVPASEGRQDDQSITA